MSLCVATGLLTSPSAQAHDIEELVEQSRQALDNLRFAYEFLERQYEAIQGGAVEGDLLTRRIAAARTALQVGEPQTAVRTLLPVVEQATGPLRLQALQDLGAALRAANEPAIAAVYLRRALLEGGAAGPDGDALIGEWLALVDDHVVPWDRGLSVLAKGLQVARVPLPDDPELAYKAGRLLIRAGHYAQAAAAFERVDESSPEYPRAVYQLGVAAVAEESFEEALAYFEQVGGELGRRTTPAVRELGILSAARMHFELGNYDQAVDWYMRVDYDSKKFPEVAYELVWVLFRAGKTDLALDRLKLFKGLDFAGDMISRVALMEGHLLLRDRRADPAEQAYDRAAGEMRKLAEEINALAKAHPDADAFHAALQATRARGLADDSGLERAAILSLSARAEAESAGAVAASLGALASQLESQEGLAGHRELLRMTENLRLRVAGVRGALDALKWSDEERAHLRGTRLVSLNTRGLLAHAGDGPHSHHEELLVEAEKLRRRARRLDAAIAGLIEKTRIAENSRRDEIIDGIRKEQADLQALQKDALARSEQAQVLGRKAAEGYRSEVLARVGDLVLKAEVGALDAVWVAKQNATQALADRDRTFREEYQAVERQFKEVLDADPFRE